MRWAVFCCPGSQERGEALSSPLSRVETRRRWPLSRPVRRVGRRASVMGGAIGVGRLFFSRVLQPHCQMFWGGITA